METNLIQPIKRMYKACSLLLLSILISACAQLGWSASSPPLPICSNAVDSVNEMQLIIQFIKNTDPNNPSLLQVMQKHSGAINISYIRKIGPDTYVYKVQYNTNCANQVVTQIRNISDVKQAYIDSMKK